MAAPARAAGADQRVVGGPDGALDGDGMARAQSARGTRAYPGGAIRRAGISRAADSSPAAFGFARQAADRFVPAACAADAIRRGAEPARARSRPLNDLGR